LLNQNWYLLRTLYEQNISEEEIQRIISIIIRLGPTPKKKMKPVARRQVPQTLATVSNEKKRIKGKEKEEKRDKKQKEKRVPKAEPPVGNLLVKSILFPKNNRQFNCMKKRYYALFSGSTKLYLYNNADDNFQNFVDTIELAPSYEVSLIGRTKNGWEFSIKTAEKEYGYICAQEDDMRSWVAYLDRRKKEITMPNVHKQKKMELLKVLEEKMRSYEEDRELTKAKIREGQSDEGLARHVEELVIMIENLQRSINATKSALQ